MAKRDLDGVVKKPYSSKLMQMKFMQKGNKTPAVSSAEKEEKTETDTHWTVSRGPDAGCSLVIESDPSPGDTIGRFSFQNCNPKTEKLKTTTEEGAHPTGNPVSDAEMAEALSPPKKKQRIDQGRSQQPRPLPNDRKLAQDSSRRKSQSKSEHGHRPSHQQPATPVKKRYFAV